ncbi:MAG TPA: serine/threonine-protein kinase [Polyangiaceae bacterium]|jgi:tetratricopeptide (TPR) repeat protein/predicted Ser/Thr protein kinase
MTTPSDSATESCSTIPARDAGRDAVRWLLPAGSLVGRYVVVERIGSGGMGSVYLAYDAHLARRVAIKVLRTDADGPEGRARLVREAQAMARLAHPNVVAVYDAGTFEERVFLAMEYVEGTTLSAALREPRPWRDALAWLKAAGRGLAAAHAAGIVHRDFKPANVLLGKDGRVAVADFGIARAHAGEASASPLASVPPPAVSANGEADAVSDVLGSLGDPLTETGALVGTVGYMSPERAFEHCDDARSDQFSFCVTLYRALYGRAPFPYVDLPSYLQALVGPPLPPPAGTPVPRWIHAVLERGLSHEPAERFASMNDLLDALDRDPGRRRRAWLAALGGATLVGAFAVGTVAHRHTLAAECRAGEGLMATTWNAETRAQVGNAIAATGVILAPDFAERTKRLLDEYARDWEHAYQSASEATLLRGEESAPTMRQRLACLDAQREEMGALVGLLSRADATIANHALTAVYGLRTPRACLERMRALPAPLAPEAPPQRVAALRRTVAETAALGMASKCDDALAMAARALPEARALPHPRSEADLDLIIAQCTRETQGAAPAREGYERLLAAAEAAGDDTLAALAASRIAFELGNNLTDLRAAERWLALAKGIRAREAQDERADAEILEVELALVSSEGHPDRSLPLRDRLIALLERLYGASHPRVAAAINNRACDLEAEGRPDLAVAEFRRAIAMQEALFSPNVPGLSIDYNNVGSALTELGRFPEAREALVHALALAAPLGENSPENVLPLASLAVLSDREGNAEATQRAAERGIAIVDANRGDEARYLPCLLVERGRALLARGAADGARRSCDRALRVQEEKEIIGPDKIYQDDALACLGGAELALGRVDAALSHLERSVSLTDREVPADLARARFTLARALTAAKRTPERARTLAESARKDLRAAPGAGRDAEEVERWIEEVGSVADQRR